VGKLTYGAIQREVAIEDRLLAHVEAVVLARLRRNNAFAIRWTDTVEDSPIGRRTIWIHQSTDLFFEYDTSDEIELDRGLLDQLAQAADSNAGINLRFGASGAEWLAAG
jgi:hypothetical protein